MMRTIEVLIVIVILTGAFIAVSTYTALPWPREVSPIDLKELSLTTVQVLDSDYDLSTAAFNTENTTLWAQLQTALSAALPANVVYNLTVYEINSNGSSLYEYKTHISNADSLGITSDASSYMVASSNVTFNVIPQKIGEGSGGTLYILNCSDTNSWWTVGYTCNSLAEDFYSMLSPYFVNTIMVQNTSQFAQILDGGNLTGEVNQNAVVINTCGEAMPVPSSYYVYNGSYYCYTLGQKVREYNWTFCSIVGYPLYYITNTVLFKNNPNSYGIYGMMDVGAAGLNAFLKGLDGQSFGSTDSTWITGSLSDPVYLTSTAQENCSYYGIYPSLYQTFTRALPSSITSTYNLQISTNIFNPTSNYCPGSVFRHVTAPNTYQGGFLALGLTRTPDIRVTALGLLSDFTPRLYRSEYTSGGTSRVVVLQLGLLGGA